MVKTLFVSGRAFFSVLLLALCCAFVQPEHDGATKKVAVIGAGSAGSSVAYYVQKFASQNDLKFDITVFERSPYVGGRSTTVDVFSDPNEPVELGASIFVKVNRNLVSAAEEFGLDVNTAGDEKDNQADSLGVWDGEKFVFQQASDGSWWDLTKLLWKYGLAPIRIQRLMKSTVGKFLNMYESSHFPFRSLTGVAQDLGLVEVTSSTGKQFLDDNKLYGPFAVDIIQASTRVNYGQNLELIHGLETMVCMATDGAMSVRGGNWQIFEGMIKSSGAKIMLDTTVKSITKNEDGKYRVSTSASDVTTLQTSYDAVIIAAPYQYSSITLPKTSHTPDEIPYVTLYVTLFTSPYKLSPAFFSLLEDTVPGTILTTLHPSDSPGASKAGVGLAGFWSISNLRKVVNPSSRSDNDSLPAENLYKIFSPHKLNATYIHSLLGQHSAVATGRAKNDSKGGVENALVSEYITWSYEKIWHSYPYVYPRVTFEELELDKGLWYTGGIESFISTMETSSLMGMNVARLVVDELVGVLSHNEQKEDEESGKADL